MSRPDCRRTADERLRHRPSRLTTVEHRLSPETWTARHDCAWPTTDAHRGLTTAKPPSPVRRRSPPPTSLLHVGTFLLCASAHKRPVRPFLPTPRRHAHGHGYARVLLSTSSHRTRLRRFGGPARLRGLFAWAMTFSIGHASTPSGTSSCISFSSFGFKESVAGASPVCARRHNPLAHNQKTVSEALAPLQRARFGAPARGL